MAREDSAVVDVADIRVATIGIDVPEHIFEEGIYAVGPRSVPDFTMIQRAFKAIQPVTWERINALLTGYARGEDKIDPSVLRVDTTVVEATIHWPTDSSLLWDSWRVLYRFFNKARAILPRVIESRFHEKKVKKLHLFITRFATSPNKKRQRKVQKAQRKLIEEVQRILSAAREFADLTTGNVNLDLEATGDEIKEYTPKVERVIRQASRAWLNSEVVPAKEWIFSIFEDHVELIKRGRRQEPVEFGHKVLLGQTREKLITQYDVMEK